MNPQSEPIVPQQPAADVPTPRTSGSTSAIPYVLCMLVVLLMAYGGWKWWQVYQFNQERGQAIPADQIGPAVKDFTLTERSGKPFKSLDMRGRVWVATYFFTTCPGQCLRLNANIQVMNAIPDLKDVTWVSITCDPDTDTLEALRKYADRFHADPERWLFCRGDLDYIKRVAKGMGVFMSLKGHQDFAIVFDKTGKLRGVFDGTSQIDCNRMHTLLLKCLAEKPPRDLAASGSTDGKSS
ncbi:MAG TPA: SCO family protein [Lacipirellulaceae bacterium]|nr:SCO family protein [Lacipirellulaceae bacterium]